MSSKEQPHPLPVAESWYVRRELADGISLFVEPHVHEFARCNIWWVRGRDRDLLVDSGTGLRPLRPQLPVTGRDLIAVATHGHFDHIGALHEFSDRRAHPVEAAAYEHMPDALTLAPLFRCLDRPVEALPGRDWRPEEYRVTPAPLGLLLHHGSRIDLGDRVFTVLHLPGHSPDSLGLFDERHGVLFSGDALYDGQLIDDFPTSDVTRYAATMEFLAALPLHVGHGGHGPSFDAARRSVLIGDYLAGRRRPGCPATHEGA